MKVGSNFSGIGAWEIALRDLGIDYELMFFSEIDKYAIKSYCAVHDVDESLNIGDITKIEGHEVPDIDLFVYSPPCQAFSVAGKQGGFDDHRGVLFFDSLRIIKHKQPKIAIMENVKGLTGKKFKAEFQEMLDALAEVGYNNYWKVLNAKDYGIPQNRERVFIVSIRKDIDVYVDSLEGFVWPEPCNIGLKLKHILFRQVDEKYHFTKQSYISLEKIMIRSKEKGHGFRDGIIKDFENEIFKGLDANYHKGCDGKRSMIQTQSKEYRMATPKECWRLQGFKDTDFDKAAVVCSNSQLYKQAGNSICTVVPRAIFEKLMGLLTNEVTEESEVTA